MTKDRSDVLPAEAYRRQVIVVLNEVDLLRADKSRLAAMFEDPRVAIVSPPDTLGLSSNPVLDRLAHRGMLHNGAVMTQNPYDSDVYFLASEAAHQVALCKILHLQRVCHYLGARSVTVEDISAVTAERGFAGRMKGNAGGIWKLKYVRFRGSGVATQQESLWQSVKHGFQSAGSEPDVDAAERYLLRYALSDDPPLRNLVEFFATRQNLPQHYEVRLETQQESASYWSALASVRLPEGKAQANIERLVSEKRAYSLTCEIEFPSHR